MVQRSAIIIGALYLPLSDIASYGITIQLITVIVGLAGIYTATYQPKIVQFRVNQNDTGIKDLYLKGQVVFLLTFIICGSGLLFFGQWAMEIIGSQTDLMPRSLILASICIYFLETNHSIAGSILLSKNEVPFFKASLISGGISVLLLILLFNLTNMNLWMMILAPGIAQGIYQNWKWPLVVIKELDITRRDLSRAVTGMIHFKV